MADSMLSTTQAIIDHGSIQIDPYVKAECVNSTSQLRFGCDNAFYKNHWYSGFAPGSSFIALPSYLVLKPFTYIIPDFVYGYPKFQVKTVLLNVFATVLVLIPLAVFLSVLLYRFTGSFIKNRLYRILTSLIFSFGTLFFYYSTEYEARVLAAFFSFASFYILFKSRKSGVKPFYLFVAGFFSSMAITIEYLQVIISGILFLYLVSFLRNKKVVYYIIGAAVPVLFMLTYNYAAFDSPFKIGYNFIQGEFAQVTEGTFSSFSFSNLWYYTFSPKYGLFFYMPVLLLCFYGLYLGLKEKKEYWREWLVVVLVFLGYLLAITSFRYESACTFGPRYLMPVIPFMFLPLPLVMNRARLWLVFIFGAVSFFVNYLPVLYLVENTGCKAGFVVLKNLAANITGKGLTNYTFNLVNQEFIQLDYVFVNIASIIILGLIGIMIWRIWKK